MRLHLIGGGLYRIAHGLTMGWLALNVIIYGVSEIHLGITERRG